MAESSLPPPALGATVRLHSLFGRPELNGKRGSVVGTLGATGRVSVKVEGEGEEPIGIKPKNLTVVPAADDYTADTRGARRVRGAARRPSRRA